MVLAGLRAPSAGGNGISGAGGGWVAISHGTKERSPLSQVAALVSRTPTFLATG